MAAYYLTLASSPNPELLAEIVFPGSAARRKQREDDEYNQAGFERLLASAKAQL